MCRTPALVEPDREMENAMTDDSVIRDRQIQKLREVIAAQTVAYPTISQAEVIYDTLFEKAHAPTDDAAEREEISRIIDGHIDVPVSSRLVIARSLQGNGFRRSEVPEPSADDRDEISDKALWDFAGDLLDAWNIEDTNAPSLAEDFRDRFVARFHPAYRPEPQGEPSDAEVEAAGAILYANWESFDFNDPTNDWERGIYDMVRAALRAAAAVRDEV